MVGEDSIKTIIILLLLLLVLSLIAYDDLHRLINILDNPGSLAQDRLRGNTAVISPSKNKWCLDTINAGRLAGNVTGRNIKIGIVDSGIDIRHPALMHSARFGFNFVDPQREPMDDNGHGTALAGVISAQGNNGSGVAGIAPEAEVYAVKVLDSGGHGSLDNQINGINWCVKNQMRIINLSNGVEHNDPRLKDAVDKAIKAGIVVVCASGNTRGFPSVYPAAYDNVISVSAIDKHKRIAIFSAEGKVDFVAPGVDVYSTSPGSTYIKHSGSSLAAAYVSGVIALMLQENADQSPVTPGAIKSVMARSALDLGRPGLDNLYGYGLINAQQASEMLDCSQGKEVLVQNCGMTKDYGCVFLDNAGGKLYKNNS